MSTSAGVMAASSCATSASTEALSGSSSSTRTDLSCSPATPTPPRVEARQLEPARTARQERSGSERAITADGDEFVRPVARRSPSLFDTIAPTGVLRTGRLLGGWVPAPSTLGTFLRAFTFRHVPGVPTALQPRPPARGARRRPPDRALPHQARPGDRGRDVRQAERTTPDPPKRANSFDAGQMPGCTIIRSVHQQRSVHPSKTLK